MIKPAQSSGFTLVELLVVVAIMIIISGATVPSFTSYLNNQKVKQAQEQVKSDLRTVQNKALIGAESNTRVNGELVQFWGIKFTNDTSTYSMFYSEVDDDPCSPPSGQIVQTGRLPKDMVIRNSGEVCIYFSIKNGDATGTSSVIDSGSTGTGIIVGKSTGTGSDCKRVNINQGGLIYNGTAGC